ncbi:MAG: sialidase family protein [Planctomycetia bacterium]|nr:sialidase family protein [Planctomycetia bacterium]
MSRTKCAGIAGVVTILLLSCVMLSFAEETQTPSYTVPFGDGYDEMTISQIDLAGDLERQIVVDREKGQYLGHPTTALMGDGKTIFCVYPNEHGKGPIFMKKSTDAGLTWSERLPTPKSWETNRMAPMIFRLTDAHGKARVFVFSGTRDEGPYTPVRAAVSEDEGATWSELEPLGTWGGVMGMTDIVPVNGKPGHYMAMFFDDGGEFISGSDHFAENRKKYPGIKGHIFTDLVKSYTEDGGVTWSFPESVFKSFDCHLIEPGIVRSPDGKRLAVLLRENSRQYNSQIIFSDDEGKTWTEPRPLPASLCGDRHTVRYTNDGRLIVSFRDLPPRRLKSKTPSLGDWIAWVGTWDDLVEGRQGQYRIRLADNYVNGDCAYPGVIVLKDGTIVLTTYGHWVEGEKPYIITIRLDLSEMDAKCKELKSNSNE